jgi:peptidoglycan/xylan/chitin deacetylase (PgdA/CDA1 family)
MDAPAGGFPRLARRGLTLLRRHGLASARMADNLRRLARLLRDQGAGATLPITAVPLDRHARLVRGLRTDPLEFALHGYTHQDYSALQADRVRSDLERGRAVFQRAGVPLAGVRAPYLRWRDEFDPILADAGLAYNSSRTVHFDAVPRAMRNEAYAAALALYRPRASSDGPVLPSVDGGLVTLPVSLPDDEMLLDRLGLRDQGLVFTIWFRILEETLRTGGLFVLQLHPERVPLAEGALGRLLAAARRGGAWIPTLSAAARQWREHGAWPSGHGSAFCVTGDIDAVSVWDHAAMRLRRDG